MAMPSAIVPRLIAEVPQVARPDAADDRDAAAATLDERGSVVSAPWAEMTLMAMVDYQ
ncbi:hypothetical protein [Streptomyces chartreusis]|uniref:Uncharacterized protein n=1 Tax=Streptomyces chartreusis TaxID=1969 RepID=A0A7I0NSJ1_STRCX|nr:hypothetical protein [Streptomyces chartreusis]QKZ16034.1 hypothetical protein HUT05_00695 [Streptomyces chartreusis]